MLNSKILLGFFVLTVAWTTVCTSVVADHYEEDTTYASNPQCKPSVLDKGVQCKNVGPAVKIKGSLYSNYEMHYVPLASAYYVARMADASGYQDRCPSNTTYLKEIDIITYWSGTRGAIAGDASCGYTSFIRRECQFPNDQWPFLCTGAEGNPGTYGKRLETLSYISIMEGYNRRWALFIHCWRAKNPENPESEEIATSFNVFNMDPVFTAIDRRRVINELRRRKFNVSPSNLIEFDYSTTNCSLSA
jgi:hypothetical protein